MKESSNNILREERNYKGGLYLEGVFYNRDNKRLSDNCMLSDEREVSFLKNNSQILDTFKIHHPDNLVYVVMKGTRRQELVLNKQDVEHSFEYIDTIIERKTNYYHYGIYSDSIYVKKDSVQSTWQIPANKIKNKYCHRENWKIPVDTLAYYTHIRANNHGFCNEDFFFSSKKDEAVPVFSHIEGDPLEKPNPWHVAEDISKLVEIVRIPQSTRQFIKSITIDYRGAAEFGSLVPEPDERTMSSIRYTDSLKLDQIAVDGLQYHVKFPDMENVQDVRLFGLTTIATILLTVLASLLYKVFSSLYFMLFQKRQTLSIIIIILLVVLAAIYIYIFQKYAFVDYNNLDFDTFDNGKEWLR